MFAFFYWLYGDPGKPAGLLGASRPNVIRTWSMSLCPISYDCVECSDVAAGSFKKPA